MSGCKICGASDLFTACSDEGVCGVCTMRFFGGLKVTTERIAEIRGNLGLADGELHKQDNAAEASRILGR